MSSTVTPNSRRSGNSISETESRPIHTAKEIHICFIISVTVGKFMF